MTGTMKRKRNRLQLNVLKRLEVGLPPTRWQQFHLHVQTAGRRRRKLNFRRTWFHLKGVLRILWKPFTLFCVSRVPVQMHVTYLIYPVGFLTWYQWNAVAGRGLIVILIILLLLCGSLLAHEFAHVFAARCCGIGTRRVVIIPFGIVAVLESMPRAPYEIWIALAGPLASCTLAGMFWLAYHAISPPGIMWHYELRFIFKLGFGLNLIVAIFNLLPCFPMDGGRVLRSLLAVVIGRVFPQRADQAFVIATRIAVRYVAWLVVLGMIALTILKTHLWLHLVLFPALLLAAEAEYWLLRMTDSPSEVREESGKAL